MKGIGKLSPLEHLEHFIQKDAVTGCWEWTGCLTSGGYGKHKSLGNGRTRPAHRAMYETLVGPISKTLDLDHLCKNRKCVNPAHLEPVSRTVNIRRSSSAKFTLEDARAVRKQFAEGRTLMAIAAYFHVSKSSICLIVNNLRWKEVL